MRLKRPAGGDLARQLDHPLDPAHVDRARLSQLQVERDRRRAVNDAVDRADQPLAVLRRQAEARLQQVAADRPYALGRGRRLVVQARERLLEPLPGRLRRSRARTSTATVLPALDQARERVHPEEARRARQQDRAAHGSPAPNASGEAADASTAAGEAHPIAW